MGNKAKKAAQAATQAAPVAQVAAAQAPAPTGTVQLYTVVAPKRPLTGTKHGNGTATTHGLLAQAAQANGGTLTLAQAQAITKAAGDPGFARYAINRLRVLVPVAPQQAAD